MATLLANLARMTTATTGTGTITLGSAASSYLTFADAGVIDGQTVTYAIVDGSNREIGRGVYTSSGTTLTRSVLKSTNAGSAISLSGTAEVFITAAAEDFQQPFLNPNATFSPKLADFTARHSTTGTYTTGDGTRGPYLTSVCANGDRIHAAEVVLAAGNFTATATLHFNGGWHNFKSFGLYYRDTATDRNVQWGLAYNSAHTFRRMRYSDLDTFVTDTGLTDFFNGYIPNAPVTFQLQNTGGTVTGRVSYNGEHFFDLSTESLTAYAATPNRIGWFHNAHASTTGKTNVDTVSCLTWKLV